MPAAIVLFLPLFGITLPDPLRQWLVTVASIWLVVKLILAIDPDFRKTWREVREILSSKESFLEQTKNVKGE